MSSRGRELPPPPLLGLETSGLFCRPSRKVVGTWEVEMDEWVRFAPAAKLLEERERDLGGGGGLVLRDSASSCCCRAFALRRLISWE